MTIELTHVPSGGAVRRYLAAMARKRSGASWTSVLADGYAMLVMIGVAIGIVMGVADQMGGLAAAPLGPPVRLPVTTVTVLLGAIGISSAWTVLTALGPANASPAQGTWLLPTPIQRRSFTWPMVMATFVVTALIGALAGLAAALATSSQLLVPVLVGACLSGAMTTLSGLTQLRSGNQWLVATVAMAILAVVAGTWVEWWPATWIATGFIGFATVLWIRSLDAVPGADLRARGRIASQAGVWVTAMDTRELGALLSGRPRITRSKPLRFVRGPMSAYVAADWRLLRRSPRRLIQLAACVLVPIVVAAATNHTIAALAALLSCGYVVALISGEGARRGERAPVLDRLLPVAPRRVRRARLVVPLLCGLVWSVLTFGFVFWRDLGGWPLMAVAMALTIAGSAVRGAYRKPPNWSGALLSTPAGALPPGVFGAFLTGPDVYLIGSVPVIIAGVIAGPTNFLVMLALVVGFAIAGLGSQTGLS